MIRVAALREGDEVAVVAPASPFDREGFERGLAALRGMGLVPRHGEGVFARHAGYLAGDDERRVTELETALRDPKMRALVLARGGYGVLRIAGRLDATLIAKSAKPVVGYSDATILHELWWRAGIPSIHGPMCTQLGEDPSALSRLAELLRGERGGDLRWEPRTVKAGRAEGPLRGGNLAVLASLCGTPLQPRFDGSIVLLEDLGEPPYRLDRLCTQLLLSGAFEGVRGFVVGDLVGETDPQALSEGKGRPEAEAVAERLGSLGVPLVLGAPFGHAGRNQPVAFGVAHALDAAEGTLTPLEAPLARQQPKSPAA